jgi:3-carboxy-cis,cis-muconate cycloisomerase
VTLFASLFVPEELRDATSELAWLEGMLDAERALANAEGLVGVIPAEAAGAIADCCQPERFSIDDLAAQGSAAGNPAEPLVRALRAQVGQPFADYVHWGATSQDIVDTAAMIVARRSLGLIVDEVERAAAACARLARDHAATLMLGRTLLQPAVSTTFGLKAAGWLTALVEARSRLLQLSSEGVAAQLGGAAGTLASLGDRGPEVVELYAAQLGLPAPAFPWHTNRSRVAELGAALAVAAGTFAKIGLDVGLLAQSDVGEVREADGGPSSTMPQKRNPVGSVRAIACARQVAAYSAVLFGSQVAEHERAFGGWQAEWEPLTSALALTGGAAAAIAGVLDGLEVDAVRMRANLDETEGAVLAERALLVLTARVGRPKALAIVGAAAGSSLRDALAPVVPADELDELLDPAGYLGSAGVLVERALALYADEGIE